MWYNYTALGLTKPLTNVLPVTDLKRYIENLPPQTPLYHGYYSFEQRDNYREYSGLLTFTFDTLHIDLDSREDGGLQAWSDTKALCKKLVEVGAPFHLYFSGSKGFHIALHSSCFGLEAARGHTELSHAVKSFLTALKREYSTVDTSIFDPSRKFRAYRSYHEKTGLYKIRLTQAGVTGKVSDLTLDAIKSLATRQQRHEYLHPQRVSAPIDWLQSLILSTPQPPPEARPSKVREVKAGTTVEDDSLKFRNFDDKKCIKTMLKGDVLPQFNRHDVELVLVTEMRAQGKPLQEAETIMRKWASRVYDGDTNRIEDCIRQLGDSYNKAITDDYKFGCYGDVKTAYCSAKCKIYPSLNPKLRPEPLDCTEKQKKQNEVRRNKMLELSEGEIADGILSHLSSIVRCEGDYFTWKGTHWERLDRERFEEAIHAACIKAYDNKAPNRVLESLFNQIKKKLPVAPENNCLFKTSPNKFNFLDGTCIVTEDKFGKVQLTMHPHDKDDYLSYCAPFPLFEDHRLPYAAENDFMEYMKSKEAHIGKDNVRVLKQMMGAALIPFRPKIFFLIGEKDSGKSTHAILLMRLLGHKNISVIDPVKEKGQRFIWEEAIGKIANFSVELPQDVPLDTNSLKKVRDKMEMDIERKGIKKVRARLPFLHVYCANKMPPSLEGNTGALASRFIAIEYTSQDKNEVPEQLKGIEALADHFWEHDAGAVLDWAREGLKELIESNFKYFVPAESREFVKRWEMENDSVSLFLEDCASGEYEIPSGDGGEGKDMVLGKVLYGGYLRWAQEAGIRGVLKKTKFYEYLKKRARIICEPRGEGGVRFNWGQFLRVAGCGALSGAGHKNQKMPENLRGNENASSFASEMRVQ